MPVILFDSKTARVAGIKSGEARRTNHVRFAPPVQTHGRTTDPDIARTVAQRVKLLAEQIAHTRTILNAEPKTVCEHCGQRVEMAPHHRAALLRALDGLLEREAYLLGIPGPGNYKPTKPTERRTQRVYEPVDVAPTIPAHGPACGPQATCL